MGPKSYSLILLPTLNCNADCDYCFEDKTADRLSLERLEVLIDKVLSDLVAQNIGELIVHWQGGEIMTLPPSWILKAHQTIAAAAALHGRVVSHGLQTNMIGYSPKWNRVIAEVFGNRISTSLDYPNLYRRRRGGSPEDYTETWERNVRTARASGVDVQVIAVPNPATLDVGAERFYRYFVDELDITSFQVNTPFPGGTPNAVKALLPLDTDALARFFVDLADVWLTRGYSKGVRVGPFDELLLYFNGDPALLPCIWTDNCANHMIAVDPRGHVAQCDCWVASYPNYRFGNIFEGASLGDLLRSSPVAERFHNRPMELVQGECIDCDYLALCHGGCPVRAYSVRGRLSAKDPYCKVYRAIFGHIASAAARLARESAAAHADSRSRQDSVTSA